MNDGPSKPRSRTKARPKDPKGVIPSVKAAIQMIDEGISEREAAVTVGVSRGTLQQYRKVLRDLGASQKYPKDQRRSKYSPHRGDGFTRVPDQMFKNVLLDVLGADPEAGP